MALNYALLTTIFPCLDDDGQPLAGGKMYFYESGGLVHKPVYQTSSGTAHAQPVVLDAAGSATIFAATGAYDIVVTDADDDQINRLCVTAYIEAAATALDDFSTFLIGSVRTVTADTTVLPTDKLILLNTNSNTIEVTLCPAADFPGLLILKNIGSRDASITPDGAELFELSNSTNSTLLAVSTGVLPTLQIASNQISSWYAIGGLRV